MKKLILIALMGMFVLSGCAAPETKTGKGAAYGAAGGAALARSENRHATAGRPHSELTATARREPCRCAQAADQRTHRGARAAGGAAQPAAVTYSLAIMFQVYWIWCRLLVAAPNFE